MKIGICTTDFQTQHAASLFGKLRSLGFHSAQLSFDAVSETGFVADGTFEIPDHVPGAALDLIRDCAERQGIQIVCVNGTFNMAHPDGAVRAEGVRRFRGFAHAVKALGCPMISLCTGTRNKAHLWRPHPDNQAEAAYRNMRDVMAQLLQIAEPLDLTLLIETEASNVIDTPEKACRLMDEMGSRHLKMIIDCANLFHPGQARRELVDGIIRRAFDAFGPDIRLAHGKDILPDDGGPDDGIRFCAAGQGIVNFELMLSLLGQAGYRGDMVLHGVYDEHKMAPARAFMQDKILRSQL